MGVERIRKLTFADDFLFYSVLAADAEICKAVIESCIGREIDRKIAEAVERLRGKTKVCIRFPDEAHSNAGKGVLFKRNNHRTVGVIQTGLFKG